MVNANEKGVLLAELATAQEATNGLWAAVTELDPPKVLGVRADYTVVHSDLLRQIEGRLNRLQIALTAAEHLVVTAKVASDGG